MSAALLSPVIPSRLAQPASGVPPLEAGDTLTRAEFHRRYLAMPNIKKAELIEGIVHMPSPTKLKRHGIPHGQVNTWLGFYEAHTVGVEAASNATVLLDLSNEYQPDVFLRIAPKCGGQTKDTEDDYVTGAPELVVEIASSSASTDMNQKKRVYLRNGVREYLVWLTRENKIVWWSLKDSDYSPFEPDEHGIIRSEVFPGLWLNTTAILSGDKAAVLTTLQSGLATDEAIAFRAQLSATG